MSDDFDKDLLAAEYVLGCIEGDEQDLAADLWLSDLPFRRSAVAWQQRLAPLAGAAAELAPSPALWARLDAAIRQGAPDAGKKPALRLWQGATAAGLAIAAGLALFILQQPAPPIGIALLSPAENARAMFVATLDRRGQVRITPQRGAIAPAGHDFELWSLAPGATKPTSLGVLTEAVRVVAKDLPRDTQLLVSLEPRGGSPTGQPTGPVVFQGTLQSL